MNIIFIVISDTIEDEPEYLNETEGSIEMHTLTKRRTINEILRHPAI